MKEYDNNTADTWICNCGKANTGKFCVMCGSPRPAVPAPQNSAAAGSGEASFSSAEWVCTCGVRNTGKFCASCGAPRPKAEAQAVQVAAARRAAEEAAARQAAEARAAQEAAARSAAKADGNKGMLMKAAIGVAVLLLLIGAYFMFGRKKEAPPAPEPAKVETKAETKTEMKADTEKPMDPAAKAEKLKEYAAAVRTANAQKIQDATANEKFVFLVEEVRRNGNDLLISGHFYNGKKNRTIVSVKSMELDIVLRDMDKELLNEKNIKYGNSFTGMNIKPLKDSQQLTVNLQGKAPAAEFNNFTVTAHDVHWEAVGN